VSAALCPTCLRRFPDEEGGRCRHDGTQLVPIEEARAGGATWDRLPMASATEAERRAIFGAAPRGPVSTIRGQVPEGLRTAPPPERDRRLELVKLALLVLLSVGLGLAIFLGLG